MGRNSESALKYPSRSANKKIFEFVCQSGLKVNAYDSDWVLMPGKGKGHKAKLGWIQSKNISSYDRNVILDVFVHYARTKSASTVATVNFITQVHLANGILSLIEIKAMWSGLTTAHKKGLNQFYCNVLKIGYEEHSNTRDFTSRNQPKKVKSTGLSSSSGALTDFEFDSLANMINRNINRINWDVAKDISFFQSQRFSKVRNTIAVKLLTVLVRRPIQISILKWSDLIPAGCSYGQEGINRDDEIGALGSQVLQIRVFKAKGRDNKKSRRDYPERFPIALTEAFSKELVQYKRLVLAGLNGLFEANGLEISENRCVSLIEQFPLFPDIEIFSLRFGSIEEFELIFTKYSDIYHQADGNITTTYSRLNVPSDRAVTCSVSSNRLRHFVLTRGAQSGLDADHLCKLTGVTATAVAHYIDMDYKSRVLIDQNFIGNKFLKDMFSELLTEDPPDDLTIHDQQFNPVGGVKEKRTCERCSLALGKPLGCYGCANFTPLLEADHAAVLRVAKKKKQLNENYLLKNPLHDHSIEKISKQISWIEFTITACDDILNKQDRLNAK